MAAQRRQLTKTDLERLNLPEEFWRTKIQTVQATAKPTVEKYLLRIQEMVEKPAGLFIMGQHGVGKTGIASLILKEARAFGYTGIFLTIWELREMIRSRIDFDDMTTILDRCREVDVLVLDGLKKEDAGDPLVNQRFLEELITSRAARKKLTILTSAVSRSEFKTKLPSFLENIKGCLVEWEIQGEDLRNKLAKELEQDVIVVPEKKK